MIQLSQKDAAKLAFQQSIQLKRLQIVKLQHVLDQENDSKIADLLHRMLREEHHHLDLLEQKMVELRLIQ